jgi:hypothetical protein
MLTYEQIEKTLITYGSTLFPCSFSDYLSKNHKVIWGLLIDPAERKFHRLFGNITSNDLAQFNTGFHDTIAGYKTDAKSVFPNLSADADVFLIAKQCLANSAKEVDALIIHELCHWYIDSGLQASHEIAISKTDRVEARSLYRRTGQVNEHITRHTIQFCELLCAVAGRAMKNSKMFSSRQEIVDLAMIYDVDGGFRV